MRRLDTLFSEKLSRRAIVDTQNPVELSDYSEPQLDVALVDISPGWRLVVSAKRESRAYYEREKPAFFLTELYCPLFYREFSLIYS